VKFEAVEPPGDDEPEESIERRLGLVEGERPRHDESYMDDDYSNNDVVNDVPGNEGDS
jgi:hypothetical protein